MQTIHKLSTVILSSLIIISTAWSQTIETTETDSLDREALCQLQPSLSGCSEAEATPEDWDPWLSILRERIEALWDPGEKTGTRSTIVVFNVDRSGELLSAEIERSSGEPQTDQEALAAIQQAAPFAPLPQEFEGDEVQINFTFEVKVISDTEASSPTQPPRENDPIASSEPTDRPQESSPPEARIRCYCSRFSHRGPYGYVLDADSVEEACDRARVDTPEVVRIAHSGCFDLNQEITVTLSCGELRPNRRIIISDTPMVGTGPAHEAFEQAFSQRDQIAEQVDLASCRLEITGPGVVP